MKIYIPLVLLLYISTLKPIFSQVHFTNGSFEDTPKDAKMPYGWYAANLGSTPDILPGFWNVYIKPSNGKSYIGLISREDGTTESIGQELPEILHAGDCYRLTLDLAHSKTYAQYNLPLELKIWASEDGKKKSQMLFRSPAIISEKWTTYKASFTTNKAYKYIVIEAVRVIGAVFFYKGNILIDNMTPIIKCDKA